MRACVHVYTSTHTFHHFLLMESDMFIWSIHWTIHGFRDDKVVKVQYTKYILWRVLKAKSLSNTLSVWQRALYLIWEGNSYLSNIQVAAHHILQQCLEEIRTKNHWLRVKTKGMLMSRRKLSEESVATAQSLLFEGTHPQLDNSVHSSVLTRTNVVMFGKLPGS